MDFNLKRLLVPAAVAAALATAAPIQARADALAVSYLGVSGFTFYSNASNKTAFNLNQFSSLSGQDQETNTANLNGAAAPLGYINQVQGPTVFVNTVDAPASCIGNCGGIGQNNWTNWTAPPTSTFSYSDSYLTGLPISLTNTGTTAGATAQTIAATSLVGAGFGGASAEIDFTSNWYFTLATSILANTAGIGFSADQYLLPWTSSGTIPPTSAHTATNWTIELLSNGNLLAEWDPTGLTFGLASPVTQGCNLNRTPAVGASTPGSATQCSGQFLGTIASALPAVDGNNIPIQYTLSLVHKSSVTANTVPEPSTVALAGIALLGLWFVRPKRRPQRAA